jgi:hypothetical protein
MRFTVLRLPLSGKDCNRPIPPGAITQVMQMSFLESRPRDAVVAGGVIARLLLLGLLLTPFWPESMAQAPVCPSLCDAGCPCSEFCMVCKRTSSPVPIFVNADSFANATNCPGDPTPYPLEEVRADVETAIATFNTSGSALRFQYAGETAAASGCAMGNCNAVVVLMVKSCESSFFGLVQPCGSWLWINSRWGHWSQYRAFDASNTIGHELGHLAGLLHPTSDPSSPCTRTGGIDPPGPSITGSAPGDGAGTYLWPNDIHALRSDSMYSYTEFSTSKLLVDYSSDGFDSVFALSDPLSPTSLRAAMAFGHPSDQPADGLYVVVYARRNSLANGRNQIWSFRGTGDGPVPWTAGGATGGVTQQGLALAHGAGVWVVAYLDDTNARRLVWQASTTGLPGGYTSPSFLSGADSNSPPGIAYNVASGKFVMAWSRLSDQVLCLSTSTVCGP